MLRDFRTSIRRFTLRSLLLLWCVIFTPWVSANSPIIQGFSSRVSAEVTLPNTEYQEATVDLRVKILGGELVLTRAWVNSQWILNPSWATLRFQGRGSEGRPLQITRAGTRYRVDQQAGLYRAGTSTLRQREKGWQWQDSQGNWIDYDTAGRITQYGNKNLTLAKFELDSSGRRLAVQDHHGRVIYRFQYDEQERLVSVSDLSGRTVGYQWQGNQLCRVTDVEGHLWHYQYDGNGQLAKRIDPDGGVMTLQYDNSAIAPKTAMLSGREAKGELEPLSSVESTQQGGLPRAHINKVIDKSGAITTWQRHAVPFNGGWWVEKTGPDGAVERHDFDREGRLTQAMINGQVIIRWARPDNHTQEITEEGGAITRLRYDSAQRIEQMISPEGKHSSFSYAPSHGRLGLYRNSAGIATEFSYDERGNLLTMTLAAGTPERYRFAWQYDTYGQPTTITQGEGDSIRQSVITYDQQGNPLTLTQQGQRKYQFDYNVEGRVTAITDPLGHHWQYRYNASGQLVQATDPLQQNTTYHYDALSRLTAIIDPLGHQLTYLWQRLPLGYRLQLTDETNRSWHYQFDALERLVKTTSPQGNETTQAFNLDGRLSQLTEPSGETHRLEYGAIGSRDQGRVVRYTNPVNQERYEYSPTGLPSSISMLPGLVQRIQYNAQDLPAVVEDSAGRREVREYNALGELTRTIDRLGAETRYRYQPNGELAAVTTPLGRQFTFEQDAFGDAVRESRPSGNRYRYQYDLAGQLTAQRDGLGNRIDYRYDAAGQLIEARYFAPLQTQPEQTIEYRYDAAGYLTEVTQRGKTESHFTFTYDARGQLLSETLRYGNQHSTIRTQLQYRYTEDGQRQSITYPDNSELEFRWQNDRLREVIHPNGQRERRETWQWYQPTTIQRPGSEQTLSFDALMRPQTSTLSVNKLIVDQQRYRYDDAGNITEQVRNGQATRYQYDAEDRLTLTRSALGSVQRLGYDAEGNRTFISNASGAWLYNDKQQLVKRGSGTSEVEYRWGVTGDLLEETRPQATTTYQYNAANQLVTVSRNNHILAEYHYDAFGRRIGKWVGGTQQWFVYSPEGLLAQLDGHGQMQQAWGWEPGTLYGSKPLWQADLSPAATLKTAKVAWLIADYTGTPLLALNDQGQTVWKGTRDPFAAVVPNAESKITVNLRYAGQYADTETGLYYNGFRYYDPLAGRYLQPDPLGLSGGLNSYVYALNNPLSYIDPEGQFPLIALLKPMAYFVGGWAAGEAMDYLISYLPDNECNPLLSPQRWANAMTYAVGIGVTHKGIKAASGVWKGTKLKIEPNKLDYLYGKVNSGLHNKSRSTQLANAMRRLGLEINESGTKILTEHLNKVINTKGNIVSAYTKGSQKFEIRESLLLGPSGKATKLETSFEIMPDGSRKFVTVIPKEGRK